MVSHHRINYNDYMDQNVMKMVRIIIGSRKSMKRKSEITIVANMGVDNV